MLRGPKGKGKAQLERKVAVARLFRVSCTSDAAEPPRARGGCSLLTSTRLIRKGFDVSIILCGPGVALASRHRGYPTIGTEGFPGNLAGNRQIETILKEGGKVYACRFAMAACMGSVRRTLSTG